MNWVNLDQDWGWPAVNLCLSRAALQVHEVLASVQHLGQDEASCNAVQGWIATIMPPQYRGAQVCGVHMEPDCDMLKITLIHPDFPRTRLFAQLPRWTLLMTEGSPPRLELAMYATGRPLTLEELGP